MRRLNSQKNHFKYSFVQEPNLKVEDPPNNLSTDLIGIQIIISFEK